MSTVPYLEWMGWSSSKVYILWVLITCLYVTLGKVRHEAFQHEPPGWWPSHTLYLNTDTGGATHKKPSEIASDIFNNIASDKCIKY